MKKQMMIFVLALLAGMAQATVLTFDTGGNGIMPQAYGDYVTNTTKKRVSPHIASFAWGRG